MPSPHQPHRKIRNLIRLGITAAVTLCTTAPTASARTQAEVSVAKAGSEQHERDVDQAALSAQDLAISRLMALLKKYRDHATQEPVLLSKLADIQQQKAAILFRLAHGSAHRTGKGADFSRHRKEMAQSIQTLDRLISRYPSFEEIPHAWFLRGKAYEEMEKKADAGRNYLHLVRNFPNADDAMSAYMSLAEFAIAANDHPTAISYLKEVEKRPEDPHFPFALYKLAWSHYNLKKISEALGYAERQIAFYDERAKRAETDFKGESDNALRENTLLDATVFYFEGYEQKIAAYGIDQALDYFKRLEKGPVLGRMLTRFAKLLRSHNHETDLMKWKGTVLAQQSALPESVDIVLLAYDYQLNHQRYDQVVACARDLVSLYARHKAYESFAKAQKQLLDTAEGLQKLIVKNKGATGLNQYSRILAQVYDSFVRVVEESDPRIPRAHYNLAETLFAIKDFAGATEHYRWVVDHGKWDGKDAAQTQDASLKAIASRYETLQAGGLIPKDLKPAAFRDGSEPKMDPLVAQWVEWIDTHASHVRNDEGIENFGFEANRALYAQGHVRRAVERMAKFAPKHPKSRYAIPQASLVLDTYIVSADWERTHDVATSLMDVPEWKKGEFSKRLFAVASDAFYKQIEERFRAHDYPAALKGSDQFLKRYAASERLGDVLALAGTAALEAIDRPRAEGYLTRLVQEAPNSPNVPAALLSRASIHEDRYRFGAAAADYRAYVSAKAQDKSADTKQLDALRRKALALTWLSGEQAALQAALSAQTTCPAQLAAECEKYSILLKLERPDAAEAADEAFEKARKDSTENRALWALLALEGRKALAFRDRNLAVRHAAAGWDALDPLVKFALMPRLARSMADTFRLNRAAMNEVAPLRADERYIKRRIEVIRELENAATQAMKLPWARIRAEVLNEVAGVYLDLGRALAALPAPKGLSSSDRQAYEDTIRKLTLPFEEKGQDMRAKAFEIASRFAIEDASFQAIAEPFFAENPSQAKALKGTAAARIETEPFGLAFLAKLDPKGGWSSLISDAKAGKEIPSGLAYQDPAQYIKATWVRAVQSGRLNQVAFFMQEAQEKALLQAGIMGAVKAISLAEAGARGEAFNELEETRRDLQPEARTLATRLLAAFYQGSYSKEKSEALLKEFKEPVASR